MSPTTPRSRSRQAASIVPRSRLTGCRARASAPWLEALEDRTLLSFNGSLQTLETQVLAAIGTSIPVVGSQLANYAPVKALFEQFVGPLDSAVANPTHDSLVAGVTSALGSLLVGNVQVTPPNGSGPYAVSAHIHDDDTIFATPSTTAGFGLGSFLTAQVTDSLNVMLHFDYLLNFTVDADGSASLDPTLASPMTINLDAMLPGFTASGSLN